MSSKEKKPMRGAAFKRFMAMQSIEVSEHAWFAGRHLSWALLDFAGTNAKRFRDAFENHAEELHAHCDSVCGCETCKARVEHNQIVDCPLSAGAHDLLHKLLDD